MRIIKLLLTFFIILSSFNSWGASKATQNLLKRLFVFQLNEHKDLNKTDKLDEIIKALILQKIIKIEEKDRFDYSDYYVFKKKFGFLGSKVLALEHEYMDSWIGCCVDPGYALFLLVDKSRSEVENFAKDNRCTLKYSTERISDLKTVFTRSKKKMKIDTEKVYYLNCKESERQKFLKD